MTLNDLEWLEWPFYVKFSLLQTDFKSSIGWLLEYYLPIYCSLFYILMTSGDVGSGVADRYPQNIWNPGKLRIFRRRYIVGTLTNKANISI